MKVEHQKVIGIEYTLKNADGEILDSNAGDDLLHFIQGEGNIVPGLEKAMDGKTIGDRFDVTVIAAEGYGIFDEERIHRIPRSQAKNLGNVKVGSRIQMRGPNGVEVLTITHVSEKEIVGDANHELAGQDLFFNIHVVDIRDATKEELEHGHAHGPGGHHHH